MAKIIIKIRSAAEKYLYVKKFVIFKAVKTCNVRGIGKSIEIDLCRTEGNGRIIFIKGGFYLVFPFGFSDENKGQV